MLIEAFELVDLFPYIVNLKMVRLLFFYYSFYLFLLILGHLHTFLYLGLSPTYKKSSLCLEYFSSVFFSHWIWHLSFDILSSAWQSIQWEYWSKSEWVSLRLLPFLSDISAILPRKCLWGCCLGAFWNSGRLYLKFLQLYNGVLVRIRKTSWPLHYCWQKSLSPKALNRIP